ncbi:MAG TPA: hypothetical protein VHM70_00155 [Polyangiaceae bacterium]|nr:hypothetical protein [Polyangiaceae bacterium]
MPSAASSSLRALTKRTAQFASAALVSAIGLAAHATTVQVVNIDPPGTGFNDPTPAAPVANNAGQTVGEQKLIVVQWAAQKLGQLLYSPVPIVIEVAHDNTLFCDANAATLASAGPAWLVRKPALVADHPQQYTWYPVALGARLTGTTLATQDISAVVNPDLGASDCMSGFEWYYGLDNDPPSGAAPFVDTVLHELTHGVGFTALTDSDGLVSASDPSSISPYFAYAYDSQSGKYWWELTAQERAASAVNGQLFWTGPRTKAAALTLLSGGINQNGDVAMYAPNSFADGSSLSHFDASASPNLLMEPFANTDLDVLTDDIDLGLEFLGDLGWRDAGCGNGILEGTEECDLGAANDANANQPDECTTDCTWFVVDACPNDPNKTTAGQCGCGHAETDTDGDLIADCVDACPNDVHKTAAGICGCGIADTDTDADNTADCNDACPLDANKQAVGLCGCGVSDKNTDNDGQPDCHDACPSDPNKTAAGACGCGVSETDSDSDNTPDCVDDCADDPNKVKPGACGCAVPDVDGDKDGTLDCDDGCPDDAAKTARGVCGCGQPETDSDKDGALDCTDECPDDASKVNAGKCGCGVSDSDRDTDGVPDCLDLCPSNAAKSDPGYCGCGSNDADTDGDDMPDCDDGCALDPEKIGPGACGCGKVDVDTDGDGAADCVDDCPDDAAKRSPGVCGCGTQDVDADGDGEVDCSDDCPDDPNKSAPGACGCGVPDVDDDNDGTFDCKDRCPDDPKKAGPGTCGCGKSDQDSDKDGVADCGDECPSDPNKTAVGECGCGVSDKDSDRDHVPDCDDECPKEPGIDSNGCSSGAVGAADLGDAGLDAGAGTLPHSARSLLDRLRDGGTVSDAEIEAWLADGGDPRNLPPEIVNKWVKQWAADGGAVVKVTPKLPDACQCRAVGAPNHAGTFAWTALALTGLGIVQRRRTSKLNRPSTK